MSMAAKAPHRLFYHPASSASMRVTLYLACRGVPDDFVELVSTGLAPDHRGIPVFTMPEGDVVTEALGTTDLTAFNPEGRVPILLLSDGRKMTQTGPIIDFLEDCLPGGVGTPMQPEDSWLKAEMRRIMWIVAADTQPYQNIPFIIQAIGEWGMTRADPLVHPLRLHFIRREFSAMDGIMEECAGKFAVGDEISLADCFLVPQIRNALLAGIDLDSEFPTMARCWNNMLAERKVMNVIEAAGGVVQPAVFDTEKFAEYTEETESS